MAKSPAPASAPPPPAAAGGGAFNGADPAKFDRDGDGHPGGDLPDGFALGEDGVTVVELATGRTWPDAATFRAERDADAANAVRVPLIELATGWLLRLDPAEAAEAVAAETARYATQQDLEIAGRPDLTPFIAG